MSDELKAMPATIDNEENVGSAIRVLNRLHVGNRDGRRAIGVVVAHMAALTKDRSRLAEENAKLREENDTLTLLGNVLADDRVAVGREGEKSSGRDSNSEPSDYESPALTVELPEGRK